MRHGADTLMDDYERNVFRPDERATPSKGEPTPVPEYTGRHPHYILVEKARKQAWAEALDDVIKFCETEHSAPLHEETAFRVSRYAKSLRQQEGEP